MKKTYKEQNLKPLELNSFRPIRDNVIVSDMEFTERLSSGGIVLPDDDMKSAGIRPRWARVYALGHEFVDDEVTVGKWVLVSHGRWGRGVIITDSEGEKTIRRVDPKDILAVADERPNDATMGDKV